MILDERTEFCDATVIGGATGRRLLGDVYDQGAQAAVVGNANDLGTGEPLYLVVQVDVAFTSGGAGTLQLEFVSDAQAAIAVDGTASIHYTSKAFALAELIAGAVLAKIAVPAGGAVPYERFLGLVGNVGTAAMTAGSLSAFLVHDVNAWKAYDAPGQD